MSHTAPATVTQENATVLENVKLARDTFRIRLEAPAVARSITPGQFVMVRSTTATDPLLGRPFALYEVQHDKAGNPHAIDLVYLVMGRGTAALTQRRPGDRLTLWGPLGNGFSAPPQGGDVLFVAGGIGQTPFVALARWWLGQASYAGRSFQNTPHASSATLLYGARTADLFAGLDDFQAAGVHVELATDDGSAGHHGFVTDLLLKRLEAGLVPARVVGCGPPPMLAALSRIIDRHNLPCDLSLENHMACGFGVCFSCVAPIRQADGSTDLRRVCVEGPIFDARVVVHP